MAEKHGHESRGLGAILENYIHVGMHRIYIKCQLCQGCLRWKVAMGALLE